jgi:hypothetical protein
LFDSPFAKNSELRRVLQVTSGRYLDLNKLSKLDKLLRMLFIPSMMYRKFSKLDFNSLTLLRWDF